MSPSIFADYCTAADIPNKQKWLVATRKLFAAENRHLLQQADQELVRCMVNDVHDVLKDTMDVQWRSDRREQLSKVFSLAAELNRLLAAQHSVYMVEMVKANENGKVRTFDSDDMIDVDGTGDDTDLAGRGVVVSVFPAVYKVVNVSGDLVSSSRSRSFENY